MIPGFSGKLATSFISLPWMTSCRCTSPFDTVLAGRADRNMAGVLENRESAFKIQRTDALTASNSSLESVRNNETVDQRIALNQLAPEEAKEDAKPGIKHARKLELEERGETVALNSALQELPVHATSNSNINVSSGSTSERQEPASGPADDSGITCKICLETKSSSTFLFLKDCQHMFCRECMSTYVEVKLTSTRVPVICPHEGCRQFLGNDDYEQLTLSPPILESLTEMEVANSIPQLEVFYCAFSDCSALQLIAKPAAGSTRTRTGEGARLMTRLFRKLRVFRDSKSRRVAAASQSVNCHRCQRLFCAQCQVPWHTGYTCKRFQKRPRAHVETRTCDDELKERPRADVEKRTCDDELKERPRADAEKRACDDELKERPTADVEKRTCEDAFKELVRKENWRECPNCHRVIELVSGCKRITCRCCHEFCYGCGGDWKTYGHYVSCP